MTRCVLSALVLVACSVPTPSREYACRVDTDCDSGRSCESGYCVVSSLDAGGGGDAGLEAGAPDAAIDAGPDATMVMSFTVASECDGSRCRGGRDGTKDLTNGTSTADKVCTQHSFTRSTSFTISNTQPGGRFCSWNNNAWACDPSCSGCNPIDNVTCSTP